MYLTLTRTRLVAVCAALVLIVCICGRFSAVSDLPKDGKTNEDRVNFAASVGCKVDETVLDIKNVYIPDEFSDVYEKYNLLQKQAGYDLSGYKGCSTKLYTYRVIEGGIANKETVINLIVYRDRIIGGDISATALDGKMLPLKNFGDS